METINKQLYLEHYFNDLDDEISFSVNEMFASGNYEITSTDAFPNPYRAGVLVKPDKQHLVYYFNEDDSFWQFHLSSDIFTFEVKKQNSKEVIQVTLKLIRYINQEDFDPSGSGIVFPENVGARVRVDVSLSLRSSDQEIVDVLGMYSKRHFENIQVINDSAKQWLEFTLRPDKDCCGERNDIVLLIRDRTTGQEAFLHYRVLWEKTSFNLLPIVVELSDPLPVYIICPVQSDGLKPFTVVGISDDVPNRGIIDIIDGSSIKYTFNLESGFWDSVGTFDAFGFYAVTTDGVQAANFIKITKDSTSEFNAAIDSANSYSFKSGSLLIEEELTPDGTYSAPYKVSGVLERYLGPGTKIIGGIPFNGVVNIIPGMIEILSDDYSTANFAKNSTLGGTPIVSGTLDGVLGTIAIDETIIITNASVNT